MRIAIVLNRTAGTLRSLDPQQAADQIAGIFRACGHDVTAEIRAGADVVSAAVRHCESGLRDVIVVGGGDGTISAAAAAAARSGVALGVLPLGTMNLFARSLGIPLEMIPAAEALAAGAIEAVDIAEVNGRLFVHAFSLGLHPRMIRLRERMTYSSRLGKIWANIQAWWVAIRQPPRIAARIVADGDVLQRRTAAILVTNNALGEGHLPFADTLQSGRLGLYVSSSRRRRDLLQLTARMSLGEFAANPLLEAISVKTLGIGLRPESVSASLDGEIVSIETPLRFGIRAGGLRVLRPATSANPAMLATGTDGADEPGASG